MLGIIGLALLQSAVPLSAGDLVAANFQDATISVHSADGTFRGILADSSTAGLRAPTGVAFDEMGRLHVASSRTSAILRFHADGRFDRLVVQDTALGTPFSLAFHPNGTLYVSSGNRHPVMRYHPETGASLGIAARDNGLKTPIGLTFTSEGELLVANGGGNNVLAFDAGTGEFLRAVASDSLNFPSDVIATDRRTILVSSAVGGEVREFDLRTGRHLRLVARLPAGSAPVGMARGCDGHIVVGDFGKSRLFELRADTVALLASTGLAGPENIAVVPGCGGG